MAREDISKWVMVVCDVNLDQILRTYSGFCVMKISEKKEWKNEIARFYEGDPVSDYEDAMSYAESIANIVLKSADIEDLWKRLNFRPEVRKNGRIRG